jgi:hypothetical protein
LAAYQSGKKCQGEAPCQGKMTGIRRGAHGHRQWRIRPEMLTDAAEFGERFHRVGSRISRGAKGDERGCPRLFIAGLAWRKG